MQWMTITSVVPCHALDAPQHVAASPFGSLNHSNDFLRPSYRSRLYITGTGKSRYAGFCLELPSPKRNADQGLRAPSTLDIATQIRLKLYRSSNLNILCSSTELQLNRTNISDIETPFLDLNLSISSHKSVKLCN